MQTPAKWVTACLLLAHLGCGTSPEPTETGNLTASCQSCHGDHGTGGIEEAHPSEALGCVDCHGGVEDGVTKEAAHVPLPEGVSSPFEVRGQSGVELDAVDPAYLRWVNPTDYRVAEQSCGGSDCHQAIVESAPSSIMTTFAGHFNKTRYSAGSQDDRVALYGVREQVASLFDGTEGTVESLERFEAPLLGESSPVEDYLDHYLEKGCPRCHVWNFGSNDAAGDFRSSGCAGCHVVYGNDGLSHSLDPTANLDDPPHPRIHQLTTSIPDEQCEHCHYRGNRIGTMYRGVREAGRLEDFENKERSQAPLHTREPGFFVFDEDTTNDVDETPPDLHQSAGLGCVDCHMGVDVHGDGRLYGAHDYQVGIECTDCHGTADTPISPDASGRFTTSAGDGMEMLYVASSGQPRMTGRLDGSSHPLVQVADLDTSDKESATTKGHQDKHLETLECYTCHTGWTQSCFGCHVNIDTRYDGTSLVDGSRTAGLTGGSRSWVTLDYLALGMGTDGQITPMAPQEKMFVSVIVPCDPTTETCTESPDSPNPGRLLYDAKVRRTHDGKLGMGFGPVVPHTTSRTSQPCDRCHLREDGSNQAILRETFGWGSGRFIIPDGDGVEYDLTQVADEATGEALVGMSHAGTDVLPKEVIERMLAITVPSSGLELQQHPAWEAP